MKTQMINTETSTNLTIDQAKAMAYKGTLTLRQLRAVLPSTKGVSKPTRDWVRDNLDSDQVFFREEYPDNGLLVVFVNGFYTYWYNEDKWTILRVDGFSRLYYEIDEDGGFDNIPLEDFIDGHFVGALGTNGLWQIKRNKDRHDVDYGETPVADDVLQSLMDGETQTLEDLLIERESKDEERQMLKKAWEKLTEQEKMVARSVLILKMTQKSTAMKLGVTQQRVSTVLNQTMRKFRNSFK